MGMALSIAAAVVAQTFGQATAKAVWIEIATAVGAKAIAKNIDTRVGVGEPRISCSAASRPVCQERQALNITISPTTAIPSISCGRPTTNGTTMSVAGGSTFVNDGLRESPEPERSPRFSISPLNFRPASAALQLTS